MFKALLALTRETHIKQLESPVLGAARGAHRAREPLISPGLTLEPLPTFYLGRARSYCFVNEVLEEAFGPEATVEADATPDPEDAERVHLALAELDPDFRGVLTLRFLEHLSVDATAEIMGVPPGTVKSRLFHAKKALKKILSREDGI